jgi:hypothetical protein
MYLHQLASACIALFSAAISAPSCGDADATAPDYKVETAGASFNEGDQSRRVPPPTPTGLHVLAGLTGSDSVTYRVSWRSVEDANGKANNYAIIARRLVARDTLLNTTVSDTGFVLAVKRPVSGADTVRFEVAAVRRGLSSASAVAQVIIAALDVAPPPPVIDIDTVPDVPPDTVVTVPPPPINSVGVAELPRVYLSTGMPAVTGPVTVVEAGQDLQAALNAAPRPSVIQLAAGAVFSGNYVLPAKAGSGVIVLRSAGTLPPEGARVTQASAANYARIVTPNSMPALRTAAGGDASHYRIVGVEITSSATMTYSIVHIGDYDNTATSVDHLPSNVVLDRVYVHGTATSGIQRCVTMHAKAGAVIDSRLSDCHIKGFDSQAIVSWLSPGPLKFVNNYLEGAGENLMIGGADPRIAGLIGSDIEIRRNHFYKPLSWQTSGAWTVKNCFELKNARRVLVEANVFENNWADGQDGFCIVLKSINDGGRCTWCETRDVTFRWNRIINSPGGFNMVAVQAYNGGGAIPMNRVVIEQVGMVGVGFTGPQVSGANYRMFQLLGNLTSIHISRVTSLAGANQIIMFSGLPMTDLRFTDNLLAKTTYGVFGDGGTQGTAALTKYAPGFTFTGNALVGVACASYPAGNTCPTIAPTLPGVDRTALDARLAGVR